MVSRRDLLCTVTAGAVGIAAARGALGKVKRSDMQGHSSGKPTVALALGGGAARGLAHIPVLEAFDELGVKPSVIAGTSIGAVIGSCYASGMSGNELRQFALQLFERRSELLRRLFTAPVGSWASMFQLSTSALIKADVLFGLILPSQVPKRFEDLGIPLKVVATDFFDQSQIIFERGALLPAIGASSALPGLLLPVEHSGRVLIDGGFVNPTPADVVAGEATYTVSVDLTGHQVRPGQSLPNAIEMLTGATQIALHTIARTKLSHARPDLQITPAVQDFESMDFYRTTEILAAAEPVKDVVKRGLDQLLDAKSGSASSQ